MTKKRGPSASRGKRLNRKTRRKKGMGEKKEVNVQTVGFKKKSSWKKRRGGEMDGT